MRAVITRTDRSERNVAVEEVLEPATGRGQVKVAVAAAGVNPIDVFTSRPDQIGVAVPGVQAQVGLGWELAGTVTEVGADVTGLEPGQAVIGLVDAFVPTLGAQAEVAVVDAGAVAALPDDADLVEAATLALNASTALQTLRLAAVGEGTTVVVTGAAGAVGGYVVELAAAAGARVVAVAREADESLVRGFGAADFVVDGPDLGDRLRAVLPAGADVVIDPPGLGDAVTTALGAGGTFVALTEGNRPQLAHGRRVKVSVVADPADLARVVADWRSGLLTTRVADVYPLEKVDEAHRRIDAGGLRGRLVLRP